MSIESYQVISVGGRSGVMGKVAHRTMARASYATSLAGNPHYQNKQRVAAHSRNGLVMRYNVEHVPNMVSNLKTCHGGG